MVLSCKERRYWWLRLHLTRESCWLRFLFCDGWPFSRFSRKTRLLVAQKILWEEQTVRPQSEITKISLFYTLKLCRCLNGWIFFTSQPAVNDFPERTRCVTAEQGTVVLMRKEDGQTSLTTHTALCLSLCPPVISLMWPTPSTWKKRTTASLALGSQMQIPSANGGKWKIIDSHSQSLSDACSPPCFLNMQPTSPL